MSITTHSHANAHAQGAGIISPTTHAVPISNCIGGDSRTYKKDICSKLFPSRGIKVELITHWLIKFARVIPLLDPDLV